VISYEVREDFAQRAQENIRTYLGEGERGAVHHIVRPRDVYEGIEEQELDRIVLDLPEPWRVVPHATLSLRTGGLFLCYLPTIVQTVQVVEVLKGHGGFIGVETIEVLVRGWHIEGSSVRPDHRMVAHTGFMTVARRVQTS
jgi:tRNA (adenine57-N1/adenine58-N1)-methyltransferase